MGRVERAFGLSESTVLEATVLEATVFEASVFEALAVEAPTFEPSSLGRCSFESRIERSRYEAQNKRSFHVRGVRSLTISTGK